MGAGRGWRWVVAAFVACGCGSDGDDGEPDAADATDAVEAAEVVEVVDADGSEAFDEAAADDGEPGDATADDGRETPDVRDETPSASVPICEGGTGSGTRRRWVDPVSGFEYCEAPCRDCTAECREVGTADEGWYTACTNPETEAGCGDLPGLIGRTDCG